MTDLPKNELFSAYLDGELSAAEQAEMDRLLATSPAARQLLDELRSLSTTLQTLPQEKLGVDLSAQVLRAAERRKLAEPGPGEEKHVAVPLLRTIFRPFRNPRAVAWLAVTAVIAVIIVINEHRQGMRPGANAVKETVLARSEKAAKKPGVPPSIQAPADQEVSSSKPAAALGEKQSELRRLADSPASPAAPAAASAPAESATVAPASSTAPMRAKGGGMAGKAGDGFRAAKKDFAKSLDRAGNDRKSVSYGQAGVAGEPAASSGLADQGVLVVRCNIRPEAVQKQALEKLLYANNIVQEDRRGKNRSSDMLATKLTEEAKQAIARDEESQPAGARNDRTVYVEATPDQIEATLAGLKAQPDVFLSFSVEPTPTNSPASTATNMAKTETGSNAQPMRPNTAPSNTFQFQQRTQVAGPEAGRGAVGQLGMNVRQNGANAAARQGVLFVLHVVDGNGLPAAAKAKNTVESGAAEKQILGH